VLAGGAIHQGTFVAEYAGELVTRKEAQQRLQEYDNSNRGHALMNGVASVVIRRPAKCEDGSPAGGEDPA